MLERSLLVTVNSDDPAYFPGYINENLVSVADAASLTNEDVLQIARNALTIAWIGEADRGRYLHDLGAYAASRQP
jgi:adenine deaminase